MDINDTRQIGRALQDRPRDEISVTTKIGRLFLDPNDLSTPSDREDAMVIREGKQLYKGTDAVCPYFDFSAGGVRSSIEASLKRTGLDRFGATQIHDPDLYPDASTPTG